MYNHSLLGILSAVRFGFLFPCLAPPFFPSPPLLSIIALTPSAAHLDPEAQGGGAPPPLSPDYNQILPSNSTSLASFVIELWKTARRQRSSTDTNITTNMDVVFLLFNKRMNFPQFMATFLSHERKITVCWVHLSAPDHLLFFTSIIE